MSTTRNEIGYTVIEYKTKTMTYRAIFESEYDAKIFSDILKIDENVIEVIEYETNRKEIVIPNRIEIKLIKEED